MQLASFLECSVAGSIRMLPFEYPVRPMRLNIGFRRGRRPQGSRLSMSRSVPRRSADLLLAYIHSFEEGFLKREFRHYISLTVTVDELESMTPERVIDVFADTRYNIGCAALSHPHSHITARISHPDKSPTAREGELS